jgi:hypothetical protein
MNVATERENREWWALRTPTEYTVLDMGYIGLDKWGLDRLLHPIKGAEDGKDLIFNSEIASIRTKVENVLGEIEQWHICADRFRHGKKLQFVVLLSTFSVESGT